MKWQKRPLRLREDGCHEFTCTCGRVDVVYAKEKQICGQCCVISRFMYDSKDVIYAVETPIPEAIDTRYPGDNFLKEEKKMQVFLTTVVECDEEGNILATPFIPAIRIKIARDAEEAKVLVARELSDHEKSFQHIKIIAMPMKD